MNVVLMEGCEQSVAALSYICESSVPLVFTPGTKLFLQGSH